MGLTLDILEGQNFARKNHDGADHVAQVHRSLPPSMRSSSRVHWQQASEPELLKPVSDLLHRGSAPTRSTFIRPLGV
jgi:hypothetical protein